MAGLPSPNSSSLTANTVSIAVHSQRLQSFRWRYQCYAMMAFCAHMHPVQRLSVDFGPRHCRSAQELAKALTVCYTAATVALNVSLFLRPGELDLVANPPWTRVSVFMAIFTFFDGVRDAFADLC